MVDVEISIRDGFFSFRIEEFFGFTDFNKIEFFHSCSEEVVEKDELGFLVLGVVDVEVDGFYEVQFHCDDTVF